MEPVALKGNVYVSTYGQTKVHSYLSPPDGLMVNTQIVEGRSSVVIFDSQLHLPYAEARPFQVANTHSWVVSENSDKAIEDVTPPVGQSHKIVPGTAHLVVNGGTTTAAFCFCRVLGPTIGIRPSDALLTD